MKLILLFSNLLLANIMVTAQYKTIWEENLMPHSNECIELQKAVVYNEKLYYMNFCSFSQVIMQVTDTKLAERQKMSIDWGRNLLGNPYEINEQLWTLLDSRIHGEISLFRIDLENGNLLNTKPISPDRNISTSDLDLIPLSTFSDSTYKSRRNMFVNCVKNNTKNPLYRNLLKVSFLAHDSVFDIFARDSYQLSWWRLKLGKNYKENKWCKIKTYTFYDANSLLFSEPEYSDTSYVFNSFFDLNYYISSYGFRRILIELLPDDEQKKIIDWISTKYYPVKGSTTRKIYPKIRKILKDSMITSLYYSTGRPILSNERMEKFLYSKFPSHLREKLIQLVHKYQEPLFFVGNFTVIKQKDSYYIINHSSGIIYLLGDKRINPVVQIEVSKKNRALTRSCFIIDKDNDNELIALDPIKWVDSTSKFRIRYTPNSPIYSMVKEK